MSPYHTLTVARKVWKYYQDALIAAKKEAAIWGRRDVSGTIIIDDFMSYANHLKARFDRIMSARSQRRKRG